ncbi:hypothetical protein HK100_002997 [Physocladia obscura]|uniref:Uncharacterized protein n=1 Tax=Physocladia obscura TaxID=109957 RepID=A0AAD5SWR1_9FUNG|nr:hypothetical protein HK100_002997 [Physocladia obscura]
MDLENSIRSSIDSNPTRSSINSTESYVGSSFSVSEKSFGNDSVDSLVLDMKVMGLESDENVNQPLVIAVESPWVYLGLLGIDVNQNFQQRFQWKAPYEEKWRNFWHQSWDKLAYKLCVFWDDFSYSYRKWFMTFFFVNILFVNRHESILRFGIHLIQGVQHFENLEH